MSTDTATMPEQPEDEPSTEPASGQDGDGPRRGGAFLSRATKASGYGRVGVGVLAAGDFAGTPAARLCLPVERVVAVDLRLREGGSRLAVRVTADLSLAGVVDRAATAAAAACGLTAGDLDLLVRTPPAAGSGTDVAEAAALAAIDAVCRATERQVRLQERSVLAAQATGRHSAGLAAAGPAIVTADGTVLAAPADLPRLLLVLAQPRTGAADAADTPAGQSHGTVLPAPEPGCSPAELAAWLVGCAGAHPHPVAATMTELGVDLPGLLGVVGGATPTSAVAALVDPVALTTAQHLTHMLGAKLPDGWSVTITRTATA